MDLQSGFVDCRITRDLSRGKVVDGSLTRSGAAGHQCGMSNVDDCFNDIVALVRREDAAAIDEARDKANAYLAGVRSRTAVERRALVDRLRRDGPDAELMEQVALAIEASA
jgi:hypothetical protein